MDTILDIAPLSVDKTGLPNTTFKGDVAVITGGGSNVGLGISRSLAALGAKVVIADINPETGLATEKLINKETGPDSALFVETDVSDELSMKAMAEKAFRTYEKVDILVNNAMDMRLGAQILKSTVYQMDRQYAISTRGALIGIQAFVPGMQRRRHGVVTYLSTAFRYPVGPSNYCAAKSATTSIMMSLASELGPVEQTGVSVFTFLPAGIGRPRPAPPPGQGPDFDLKFEMPGYGTFIPPEDCGAAMAYAISRAKEIHGSGVMINQVFRQMNWPYPQPETVPQADFERINEHVLSLMFAYMGPGFKDPKVPLRSINYSDNIGFPVQ